MTGGQADVVVVGAGMSGLCASVAALERGARVIALDKGTRFGGSMALSGGQIWSYKGMDLVQEYIPDGNPLLQSLVVEGLGEANDWLEGHGVPLEPACDMGEGYGRKGEPPEMTAALVERIRALGGQLYPETALADLLYEGGVVRGVRAFGPDGETVFESEAVVLATGGFQGNPELVTRYITPNVSNVHVRSNPWSTGDAFLAATQIGAAVTPGLDCFYGHALAAPPASFPPMEFLDMSQKYGTIAVALNLDGSRFADESAGSGEEVLNIAIAHQRNATAFYVLDANLMETLPPQGTIPRVSVERVRARGGTVLESDTLEGLCDLMGEHGVHSRRALATLNEFNAALLEERTEELFPERRKNQHPLVTPPFTAVPVRPGITFSNGGLEVDTEMCVLRRSTTISTNPNVVADQSEMMFGVIPGLFAAGCDAGNISHRGYMGGLAQALVTGRIAGHSAADLALSARDADTGERPE